MKIPYHISEGGNIIVAAPDNRRLIVYVDGVTYFVEDPKSPPIQDQERPTMNYPSEAPINQVFEFLRTEGLSPRDIDQRPKDCIELEGPQRDFPELLFSSIKQVWNVKISEIRAKTAEFIRFRIRPVTTQQAYFIGRHHGQMLATAAAERDNHDKVAGLLLALDTLRPKTQLMRDLNAPDTWQYMAAELSNNLPEGQAFVWDEQKETTVIKTT